MEKAICLGHRQNVVGMDVNWVSDLQVWDPVCMRYLLVAMKEVNKMVSWCLDPLFHPVHILLCREMANLKMLTQKTVPLQSG